MEERGISILFQYNRCHAELYNQTIEINLRQKYHRVRTIDKKGWSHQEYVKSNKLEFQTGYHARKNWLDTDKRKIEDRIPEIVAYIEKDLTYWRDLRKQQAIDQELKNIELQKQEDIKRLQQIEEEKTVQLFKDAENWNKAERLRKYIAARKEQTATNRHIDKETKEWFLWANTKVIELDPLL